MQEFLDLNHPLYHQALIALLLFCFTLITFLGLANTKHLILSWCLAPLLLFLIAYLPIDLSRYAYLTLFGVGFVRFFFKLPQFSIPQLTFFSPWEKGLALLVVVHIFLLVINTLTPASQNDVLVYHLLAPKEWVLNSTGPIFRPDHPNLFLSTYMEYFYYAHLLLLKPLLIALKTEKNWAFEGMLLSIQLWAQMLIAFTSFVLIPMIVFSLFKTQRYWRFLIIEFLLGAKTINWTWTLAKNDSLPLLTLLLAYWYWKNFRHFKIVGLLLGLCIAYKFSNLMILSFLFIFTSLVFFKETLHVFKYEKKGLLWLIGCSLLTLTPLLFRNWHYTHDPFFPVELGMWKNKYYNRKTNNYVQQFNRPSAWSEVYAKLSIPIAKGIPTLLLFLPLFFHPLSLFIPLLFVIIAKNTGPPLEWRLFSTILFICLLWFEQFLKPPRSRAKMLLLALVILLTSKIPFHHLKNVARDLNNKSFIVLSNNQENFSLISNYNRFNWGRVNPWVKIPQYYFDLYYYRFKSEPKAMTRWYEGEI